MWEIRDGFLIFRLIDWDMATIVPLDGTGEVYTPSATHRTGTLPFIAWELVLDAWTATDPPKDWKPIAHLLRHDFASLFFISLWCAELLPTEGVDKEDLLRLIERAKSLEKGGLQAIALYKQAVCQSLKRSNIRLPRAAECLVPWFSGWQYLFTKAICADAMREASITYASTSALPVVSAPPPYDYETADGILTRDTIKATLGPCEPPQKWTIDELLEICASADADHGPNYLLPMIQDQKSRSRGRATRKRTLQPPAVAGPSMQTRAKRAVKRDKEHPTQNQSIPKQPKQLASRKGIKVRSVRSKTHARSATAAAKASSDKDRAKVKPTKQTVRRQEVADRPQENTTMDID